MTNHIDEAVEKFKQRYVKPTHRGYYRYEVEADPDEIVDYFKHELQEVEKRVREYERIQFKRNLVDWISSEYVSEHFEHLCVSPKMLISKTNEIIQSLEEK